MLPVFQSGGNFDLRPDALSNSDYLYYDSGSAIICAIGSRYNRYCSNIARTIIVESTGEQKRAYEVLLKAQEAAIQAVKPETRAGAVYGFALAVVQRDAPDLVQNLTKSAGSGIGLEFRESGFVLNAKNDRMVKAGMVFNVSLGFQNLQATMTNPKFKTFSLFLADTVIVTENGHEVVTSVSKKSVEDMCFDFEEDDDQTSKNTKPELNMKESVNSKAALRSDKGEISKENLRKQHQTVLVRQMNEETFRRLTGVGSGTGDGRSSSKIALVVIAFKHWNDIPTPPRETIIMVDQKHDAVLLRIYGHMVPFHISTVKNVDTYQDNHKNSDIRITFTYSLESQGAINLKEIRFRSNSKHINEVAQQIKTLKRNFLARESERAERATLVNQERLLLAGNKFKPVRLSELWIRPTFGGRARKLSGTLEAHMNGLRYSTSRANERVDILYRNIKHAIFQPAEKELITLLHFHLHHPIMVGTKSSKDVQFYVEVMEMVQTLRGSRRSAYDPDEIEEEQRERDRKNKINMDFQNFVNRVNDQWKQPQFRGLELEFDQPLRELGFHGVPHKSSAFMVPTTTALVELIENQFVVISLSDIEVINLERVGLAQKNFDMAIVFKDFKRDVMRIDSIPSSSLDGIKEWLDTADIKYYESRLNLNWRPILKTITEDPHQFLEDGGWEFLNLEAEDSAGSNESEESAYEMSEDEPESESEDDDSDSESLVESEDDEEEDSEEGSEEDEGKTWDELEREASNADREMGNESDSEDERRRKLKASGKSRAAPSIPPLKRSKVR